MIDSEAALAPLISEARTAAYVALDTEADSLHAYPEKLCLVQISVPSGDYLVDPLGGMGLSLFFDSLQDRDLLMHGADYDLRLVNRSYPFLPRRLFDTMEAARLLGQSEFGLAALVERYLGVKLEKGPQTANWGRRPLTARMESYAKNDTRYLKPLAEQLRSELRERGRLSWHEETCARLAATCAAAAPPDPNRTWRLKGSRRLSRLGLCLLRELWEWREGEAVAANRPPYFILSHEQLIELAEAVAHGKPVHALLPRRFPARRQLGLDTAIARALSHPPDAHPEPLRFSTRRPSRAEIRRFEELRARRDRHAASLGIDPALIASRSSLLELARDGERFARELMEWQRRLLH